MMTENMQKIQRSILLWSFAVLLLLLMASSDGNKEDEILKYMCTPGEGAAFWRDIIECCLPMDKFMESAVKNCLLLWNPYDVESTRRTVCAKQNEWRKVMNCIHLRMVELQKFDVDVNPNEIYTNCVNILIIQMKLPKMKNDPFPEQSINSRCLRTLQVISAR